jgi:(E)-4-hydroxy-3-methylbut-2-enyl-diphosphate synthase
LLASRLEERAPNEPSYPFHIGVTEAGDGEDGRIKSAIGIGALLADGIGDTIRVSLTESPEEEVPVAASLATLCEGTWGTASGSVDPGAPFTPDPYAHCRRATRSIGPAGAEIGGDHPVRVEVDLGPVPTDPKCAAEQVVQSLGTLSELQCEGLALQLFDSGDLSAIQTFADAVRDGGLDIPLTVRFEPYDPVEWPPCVSRLAIGVGALIDDAQLDTEAERAVKSQIPVEWDLRGTANSIPTQLDRVLDASARAGLEQILVSVDAGLPIHAVRLAAARLDARGAADVPIVLRHRRGSGDSDEKALLRAAHEFGALLCDGIGDAISLQGFGDPDRAVDLGYRILQGSRRRSSRTEYISCPSCGRTLFDLVETTDRIKKRTDHLPGVKIAIMGCIVNGPGEMADADFGYVGSGPGRVNLYVGKELVVRNVPDSDADDRLVELIRERGDWVDPA